ncbi:MAG: sodium:proton antiporter [Rhodococcus sp.]|nr:sodium:proton antiporter [Rhodococcus sp. (in: high G+C Gram-positive bacteria)]
MDITIVITLAVLVIVAVSALAPKVGVSAPLLLVALGVGVSFLPFVADFEIDPDWILAGVLPPLLYSSAVNMPTMDFRRDFRTISAYSVVLVVASAVVVGFVMSSLIPGIGLATGIALGAIISPTDAVATSIVKHTGASPRIVTVLEGESMLNDASSLVILRSAVAATAASVSLWQVAGDFVYAVIAAVVVGVVVGRLSLAVRAALGQSTLNVAISLVVPFVAYIPAEELGASGLVATVTAGLVSGAGAPRKLDASDRLNERAVWKTLELLLESSVFLVMGLELSALVDDVHNEHGHVLTALWFGAIAAALVIVVRIAFVVPSIWLLGRRARKNPQVRDRLTTLQDQMKGGDYSGIRSSGKLPSDDDDDADLSDDERARRDRHAFRARFKVRQRIADIDYLTAEKFGAREGVVLVWAGMRGAVTLAAAQSLPTDTPQRSLIILIAFVVAAGTLLIQGGTLGWVVNKLGLRSGDDDSREEWVSLRRELDQAAAKRLASPDLKRPDGERYSPDLLERARSKLAQDEADSAEEFADRDEFSALIVDIVEAQRDKLLVIRDLGTYSSTMLDAALRMLDAREIGFDMRRNPNSE